MTISFTNSSFDDENNNFCQLSRFHADVIKALFGSLDHPEHTDLEKCQPLEVRLHFQPMVNMRLVVGKVSPQGKERQAMPQRCLVSLKK